MSRSIRRGLCAAALLVPLVNAVPAAGLACTEHSLFTGDQDTTTFGYPDWRWQLVSSPAGTVPAPAYVVRPVSGAWYPSGPGEPRWISASGAATGTATWSSAGGYYTYRAYFYDPPGGSTGLAGAFAVDNAVDVFVNGTHWLRYDPSAADLPAAFRDFTGKALVVGQGSGRFLDGRANTLDFRVHNYWTSPEGLLFWGNVRYCT